MALDQAALTAGDRPRLVLVIGTLQAGGAERQLADMANYWAGHAVQVTLATWSGREVEDFYALSPRIERVWLVAYRAGDGLFKRVFRRFGAVFRLRRLLRRERRAAVLSFIDVSNVHTILAAFGLGLRVVVTERTHPAVNFTISRPWRALRKKLYSRASKVVAQTQDAAQWIERECRTHVLVIPNALRPLPTLAIARTPLILGVGRLSHEKGFDLLLRVFARLASQFPQWRVSILGEGPYRAELTALRDALQLADRVELVGQVANPEAWMARASVLVHPSRREGFPNVVLEAMALGTAVLCTDCRAGPSELIRDGVNGRLVPVDAEESLAGALAELMSDPDLRARLGREAAKVQQQYGQDAIMRRWDACVFGGHE